MVEAQPLRHDGCPQRQDRSAIDLERPLYHAANKSQVLRGYNAGLSGFGLANPTPLSGCSCSLGGTRSDNIAA